MNGIKISFLNKKEIKNNENDNAIITNLFHKIIHEILQFMIKNPDLYDEKIDQSQEKADDYYKYDRQEKDLCQSFVPSMAKITKIELYLGRKRYFDSPEAITTSLPSISGFEAEIGVAILDHPPKDHEEVLRAPMISNGVRISQIPKDGGWVAFDFKYGLPYKTRKNILSLHILMGQIECS